MRKHVKTATAVALALTMMLGGTLTGTSELKVYAADANETAQTYISELEAKKTNMENDLAIYPNCQGLIDAHNKLCSDIEDMKQFADMSKAVPNKKSNVLTAGVTAALNSSDTYDQNVEAIYQADKDIADNSFYGYYNVSPERMQAVNTALSAEGRIKYVWGGKPSSADWQSSWDDKTSGLDCSGFVSFVYWNTTGTHNEGLDSTYAIARHAQPINETDLQPGDIGMLNDRGTFWTVDNIVYETKEAADQAVASFGGKLVQHTGHVGIYVGLDANGNKLFCHCKGGSARTVVVDNFNFKYFYRMFS